MKVTDLLSENQSKPQVGYGLLLSDLKDEGKDSDDEKDEYDDDNAYCEDDHNNDRGTPSVIKERLDHLKERVSCGPLMNKERFDHLRGTFLVMIFRFLYFPHP